jgi:hypothetical protein
MKVFDICQIPPSCHLPPGSHLLLSRNVLRPCTWWRLGNTKNTLLGVAKTKNTLLGAAKAREGRKLGGGLLEEAEEEEVKAKARNQMAAGGGEGGKGGGGEGEGRIFLFPLFALYSILP